MTTNITLPKKRSWKRIFLYSAAFLVLFFAGGVWWIRSKLLGSMPRLEGELQAPGITARVEIQRDEFSVPTLRCQNLKDMAFAMGFLHAQERYFQMDMQRRYAAGELAEILGAGPNDAVLNMDRSVRVHRFRKRAEAAWAKMAPDQRTMIEAYAQGVNFGLSQLAQPPLEYLLLNSPPAPWKPEDCLLTLFMMFLNLQHRAWDFESVLSLMHDTLPTRLYEFIGHPGSEWDAPLNGGPLPLPPLPGPGDVNLRLQRPTTLLPAEDAPPPIPVGGSNAFAVSGRLTPDGKALLANDMHLEHRVPNIWYLVRLEWPDEKQPGATRRAAGVTLPGGPVLVVGSNDHIAWGFTNSHADWLDYILLDIDDKNPQAYLTPSGRELLELFAEVIKVKDREDVQIQIYETKWGPVFDLDHKKRKRVLRWCAYDQECINLDLQGLMTARSLEEAMEVANRSGGPQENILIAAADGRIAWTILGRIPKRVGFDGRLPQSWKDGRCRWDGYYPPEQAPRIVQPEQDRLWSANARQVSGPMLDMLGFGDYDMPARSKHLRDALLAKEKFTVNDLLQLQLDDRALSLERWQQLLMGLLTEARTKDHPLRAECRQWVDKWNRRATPDAVGMTLVFRFRNQVIGAALEPLLKPCHEAGQGAFSYYHLPDCEGVVWRLISEKPLHLLSPAYEDWDALLLRSLDLVLDRLTQQGKTLAQCSWGAINEVQFHHPLSGAMPKIMAERMNWPSWQGYGAVRDMPRVQGTKFGASMRMGVKVGDWQTGYLHMPGGQSGHPLSSHYRDLHEEWREGKPTPIWPTTTGTRLVLLPTAPG